MRQVRARTEQRIPPAQRAGERVRQIDDGRPGLISHEQGNDAHVRHEAADERQLHFERMLLRVRGRHRPDERAVRKLLREAAVDHRGPERRVERAFLIRRDPVEPLEVRRPDEHGCVVTRASGGPVRIRRHRP